MPVFSLFSKRQKALRGETPDIYTYDEISEHLRVQIVTIIKDAIGVDIYSHSRQNAHECYEFVWKALCREYGQLVRGDEYFEGNVLNFILKETDIEKVLSAIELCFRHIYKVIDRNNRYSANTRVSITPTEATEELNERFREHGVGYQFDVGEIIRVDSTFMHSEVVKPALLLLSNKKFEGANEEYLKAHEHYRHGRNKECLTDCLKAFESTLKSICLEKGWAYDSTDTAKKLIQKCF
jgi:hypothetical protein